MSINREYDAWWAGEPGELSGAELHARIRRAIDKDPDELAAAVAALYLRTELTQKQLGRVLEYLLHPDRGSLLTTLADEVERLGDHVAMMEMPPFREGDTS